MSNLNELHIKTLLATAGVPVTSKVGTNSTTPSPAVTAIYLPPDVSIERPSPYNDTKSYPDGVFVSSVISPVYRGSWAGFRSEGGFDTLQYMDPAAFEKAFGLSDSKGQCIGGNIDMADWASRTAAAANQLREAGLSTMPVITVPSIPGPRSAPDRSATNECE